MRLFFTALLLLCMQASAAPESALSVDNGQIRLPMPGRSVTAGYFTLHNASAQPINLTAVSTTAFARAELHQHSHKDGMMRMEQIDHIVIPANASIELAPGGLHLMLFEPTTSLEVGQVVELLLHFADGQQLTTSLPVVAMPKR